MSSNKDQLQPEIKNIDKNIFSNFLHSSVRAEGKEKETGTSNDETHTHTHTHTHTEYGYKERTNFLV